LYSAEFPFGIVKDFQLRITNHFCDEYNLSNMV
jgi:hypothetical protein